MWVSLLAPQLDCQSGQGYWEKRLAAKKNESDAYEMTEMVKSR